MAEAQNNDIKVIFFIIVIFDDYNNNNNNSNNNIKNNNSNNSNNNNNNNINNNNMSSTTPTPVERISMPVSLARISVFPFYFAHLAFSMALSLSIFCKARFISFIHFFVALKQHTLFRLLPFKNEVSPNFPFYFR